MVMDILEGLCYAKILSKMPPLKAMTGRDPDFVRTGLIETDREIRSVFFCGFVLAKVRPSQDRDLRLVRACALKMHFSISEEPLGAKNSKKNAAPHA